MTQMQETLPYEKFANNPLYASTLAYINLTQALDRNAAIKAKNSEIDAERLQKLTQYWYGVMSDPNNPNSDLVNIRNASDSNSKTHDQLNYFNQQFQSHQTQSQAETGTVQSLIQQEQTNYSHATDTETSVYQMNISSILQLLSLINQALVGI